MADGDLALVLTLDDGIDPDAPPPPLGSVGAELYAAHAPLAWADRENGWALLHMCEAIGRMWQAVDDLIRDTDDGVGWSALVDVDRAPGADGEIDALPWLGQLAGVRLISHLGDSDRRDAIRRRDGLWRGTPDSVVSYAERFTVGGNGVILRERYSTSVGPGVDAPYRGQVRVRRSHLLPGTDAETLRRALIDRIPAGLLYDVLITDEQDWNGVEATWRTWAGVEADGRIWNDVNIS